MEKMWKYKEFTQKKNKFEVYSKYSSHAIYMQPMKSRSAETGNYITSTHLTTVYKKSHLKQKQHSPFRTLTYDIDLAQK